MRIRLIQRFVVALIALNIIALVPIKAQAVPITSDLDITGSVDFNLLTDNFIDSGTNLGEVRMIGSSPSSAGFSGTAGDSTISVAGTLTDTGDGFGASTDLDLTDGEFFFTADWTLNVQNTSADDYKVTFKVNHSNVVDADGAESFSFSAYTFDHPFANEVFFSDVQSDTESPPFNDELNGDDLGTAGAVVSDIGMDTFDVIISAGTTEIILGELVWEGGVFDTGLAKVDFSGDILVDEVINLSQPPRPIPEPGTFILLSLGLGFASTVAIRRSRRRARENRDT